MTKDELMIVKRIKTILIILFKVALIIFMVATLNRIFMPKYIF